MCVSVINNEGKLIGPNEKPYWPFIIGNNENKRVHSHRIGRKLLALTCALLGKRILLSVIHILLFNVINNFANKTLTDVGGNRSASVWLNRLRGLEMVE